MATIEYAAENRALIETLGDRVSLWVLGYLYSVEKVRIQQLPDLLEIDESENFTISIQRLIDSHLVTRTLTDELELTLRAQRFLGLLGLQGTRDAQEITNQISMDVFVLGNMNTSMISDVSRTELINSLIEQPRLYGAIGYRYGFVECGSVLDDVVYGYFTQEYLGHSIKYDDDIKRQDTWDERNANMLFIWPTKSDYFILQDTRFFGIPTLDMTQAKSRILIVMNILRERFGFEKIGDIILTPYKRELSAEEMYKELMSSKREVTRTRIDLKNGNTVLPERLAVFNPREDWNEMLTQIIAEYEIPNISNATFKSTKGGSLKDSAIVKALALSGKVNYFQRGRGKQQEIIKRLVPTHIGRIEVAEPVSETNILSILGFIQDNLGIKLTEKTVTQNAADQQMRFENI